MLGELAKMAGEEASFSATESSAAQPATPASAGSRSAPPQNPFQRATFVGVSWHKSTRKWQAKIQFDGRRRHLGYFGTKEDAARKYDEFAVLQGRPLNFPPVSPATECMPAPPPQ